MSSKRIAVDCETQDMLDKCIAEYRSHHPELDKIHISRNKIIYEIGKFYLKT